MVSDCYELGKRPPLLVFCAADVTKTPAFLTRDEKAVTRYRLGRLVTKCNRLAFPAYIAPSSIR